MWNGFGQERGKRRACQQPGAAARSCWASVGLAGPCPGHLCTLLVVATSLLVSQGELLRIARPLAVPLPDTGFPREEGISSHQSINVSRAAASMVDGHKQGSWPSAQLKCGRCDHSCPHLTCPSKRCPFSPRCQSPNDI